MNRHKILESASDAVADREGHYGAPIDNFQTIAELWMAILGNKLEGQITAADVAMMMCCVKLARLKTTPNHEDSAIDLAGYAALLGEIP
tara:strand:+ start:1076 stop:1342 length:267 start_codon:yes stop_codon:yes gene_type:complete